MLEQYTIADILAWLDDKTLVVNRDFQRGDSVWPSTARAYLIDTILRERPMPKIYLRTMTDVETRRSYREVIDGQQRLKAIQDFARGNLALGTDEEIFGEYAGNRYSDLDEETQKIFLSYLVGVEQIFNVPDSVVFDIFQRLNTYNYNLSGQELRHGKFHGALRNAVVETSRRWSILWDRYGVVTRRARVRMADDELMAQMFGIILGGVVDGGQPKISKLYKDFDGEIPKDCGDKVVLAIEFIVDKLEPILETGLGGAPHFLMLFAAVAHALFGIPRGAIDDMPKRDSRAITDIPMALSNLGTLADVLEKDLDQVPERFSAFRLASAGTTQRIRSRRIRFPKLYEALLPEPI